MTARERRTLVGASADLLAFPEKYRVRDLKCSQGTWRGVEYSEGARRNRGEGNLEDIEMRFGNQRAR